LSIKNTCRAIKNKRKLVKDGHQLLEDDMTADNDISPE